MDGTILGQGTFTVAAGVPQKLIQIPSSADWMKVYNYTQAADATPAGVYGFEYYWQRGMAAGTGMVKYKTNAGAGDDTVFQNVLATGGFTLLDTSVQTPGNAVAITAMTAANPPVVTTGTTPAVGSIVRLYSLDNQPQFGGMEFTVTAETPATNFTVGNLSSINSTASTAGFWRQVPHNPIYYPRRRFATYVRAATEAVIYLSVTHQFAVGQSVRLSFPGGSAVWGNYAALDGRQATITAVNVARAGAEPNNGGTANNIQVDVDTSAFGAWAVFGAATNEAYPPASAVAFTPAAVVPQGEDSAESLTTALAQAPLEYDGSIVLGTQPGLLSDATNNLAYLGMTLGTGNGTITGPAGSVAADAMYWVAGKSTFGGL